MAIVQVSRITNRKGLTENLPQLAGAEFGWCIDTRRLFIGNGTLEEGAPVIGNTEILTEFSDIIATADYIYKDSVIGYTAQTNPDANDPVIRTVQAKLDDFASVRDFGATGDGITDDTVSINWALNNLYCVDPSNTESRRTLYFPAGTYRITESLIIPTWAKLVGEGADCTTILLDTSGDISTLSAYVARTGDSLQQTGAQIGLNGATPPRNIEISSITFQTTVVTDVFLVEKTSQMFFDSCNFRGPLTSTDIANNGALDNIAGVRFASSSTLPVDQVTFDKCRFTGLTYGMETSVLIQGVTVSNCELVTLYQGLVMGDGAIANGGPIGFRAVHNLFNQIYGEGIIYDDVTLNISAYNIFLDVGNEFQGAGNPTASCILLGNDNNVSVSDMFQRDDNDNNVQPRVEMVGGIGDTGTQIQLGRYARDSGRTFIMDDNESVPQTIFTWSASLSKTFSMNYTIERGTALRRGVFSVVAWDADASTLTLSYDDEYNENSPTGVVLSADQSGSNILIKYTTTNTGDSNGGTLTYSISHLA